MHMNTPYYSSLKIVTFVLKNLTTFSLSLGFFRTSTAFKIKETGCKTERRMFLNEHFSSLEQQKTNSDMIDGRMRNKTINYLMSCAKVVE